MSRPVPRPSGPTRVGLIGFGAIGKGVAGLIQTGALGAVELVGVVVRDPSRHRADRLDAPADFTTTVDAVLAAHPDVIVEAGGHAAVREHVERCLAAGIDVVLSGVGALEDDHLRERLAAAAIQGGCQLRLSSGGIGGLDALAGAALLGLDSVVHVVRKPPEALLDRTATERLRASGQPVELYVGPARDAVRRYPQNVNVVAAVCLAGIGFDRTEVRIVADPSITRNTHDIVAEGVFGRMRVVIEGVPTAENPRTGRLVAGALGALVRSYATAIVIGQG